MTRRRNASRAHKAKLFLPSLLLGFAAASFCRSPWQRKNVHYTHWPKNASELGSYRAEFGESVWAGPGTGNVCLLCKKLRLLARVSRDRS